jgi:hypothetical protein
MTIPTPDRADEKATALKLVARVAKRAEQLERDRYLALRHAADSGASLREIAEAAGLSHMGVKAILERK